MNPPFDKSHRRIAAMFDDLAPRYDFLNHLLSLNSDKRWRRAVVRRIVRRRPATVLDVATGTGDLAIALRRQTAAAVTGVDISEGMLAVARRKTAAAARRRPSSQPGAPPPVDYRCAAAEALPFPDGSFDAVTVAFGVRNFDNLDAGLREIGRVLKPAGVAAILEFSTPTAFLLKQAYRFYFHRILPAIGRLASKHRSAYRYLPASVDAFPSGDAFVTHLQQAGFINLRRRRLSWGIATIYEGEKRDGELKELEELR
jgi:demethylmenaquinone methyltransferase/2-methoxy-6-polyprenyl-1,4-benzoquinol methylase